MSDTLSHFYKRRLLLSTGVSIGLGAFLPSFSFAQASGPAFPSRPLRIVVPYTPGGTNDVIARVLAQKLQEMWSQPVIVENKPGAAGNVGASEVARASPDGYTLLLSNINIVSMNPALMERMPFDPQKDFAPISLLGTSALMLVVNPSVPVQSVRQLIELAKREPGRLSYASSGNGSPQHMSAEMFKALTKTNMLHVPYRGAAPAITDLLAGQVHVTVGVVNQLLPHLKTGKLRALGVTSRKRLASAPEIPTLDESGVPGYESEIWLGLAAPAGTPAAIVNAINQAVHRVMAMHDVAEKLNAQGIDILVSTPEQMRQRSLDDLKRWGDVIRTAGIRLE